MLTLVTFQYVSSHLSKKKKKKKTQQKPKRIENNIAGSRPFRAATRNSLRQQPPLFRPSAGFWPRERYNERLLQRIDARHIGI